MSDFTSNFWSVFVTALTLVGIIGCAVLLWMAGRKKVVSTADNTTGHVWDEDLVEMNNPLPRWWVWMFVLTIIFGLGYLAARHFRTICGNRSNRNNLARRLAGWLHGGALYLIQNFRNNEGAAPSDTAPRSHHCALLFDNPQTYEASTLICASVNLSACAGI